MSRPPRDLFEPVVDEGRLDPRFRAVMSERQWAPARATMREVFAGMGDRDGNFIQQFQTDGFDARVWELYLFAAFDAAGLDVRMEDERPDFLLAGRDREWAVEATTANPSGNRPPPAAATDPQERLAYMDGELAVRLGGALVSKLSKRYWELPHVAGKPFVLAIQSFASEDSLTFADTTLVEHLYGLRTYAERDEAGELHVYNAPIASHRGSKTISSGFFALPDAEHVSAVLWSNSGTVPKFARMGFQDGVDSAGLRMIRAGTRHVMDPNASEPARFLYEVGSRRETWPEGLTMAHNPRALHPLTRDAFPGIAHHAIEHGLVTSWLPPFQPYRSETVILVVGD